MVLDSSPPPLHVIKHSIKKQGARHQALDQETGRTSSRDSQGTKWTKNTKKEGKKKGKN